MNRRLARHAERLVIVALLAAAIACGRSDPPRLEVSALDGSTLAGTSSAPAGARADAVRVGYRLRNVGGRALGLDGVAPACGCRAATRLAEALEPGASTTLAVECRAPEAVGETVRELLLRTSDPTSPVTTLRVALQRPLPGPAPSALYFGYVPVGESAVRDVVLPVAVAAEGLTSARPELAIEALPARPDGAHGIRVRFTPSVSGIVRATLDLGAGGALPVTAVGYDQVLAFPAEVAWPVASAAAGLTAVTLMGVGPAPLVIARVDYPRGMSGELRAVTPGRQLRLVLRGRSPSGGTAAGAIRLYGAAGSALLTIPVVGADTGAAAPPA